MHRLVLIFLVACVQRPAPQAPVEKPYLVKVEPAPPVNLICKKFSAIDAKAACDPELTDDGPSHIHTATVTTQGQMLSCRQDTTLLGMMCGHPVTDVRPVAPVEDAKPAKKAKKK